MKSKILLYLELVLMGATGCASVHESPTQYIVSYPLGDRPDILSYSKASAETMRQIKIDQIYLTKDQLGKLNALPKSLSQNSVRWIVEEKPDTMRNGPWNTELYIFARDQTNRCLHLALLDNNGRVDHAWLNDKMLFVEVWFGRIAWTDFILDAETHRFVYCENGRLDPADPS
jgi:hypothetical protein